MSSLPNRLWLVAAFVAVTGTSAPQAFAQAAPSDDKGDVLACAKSFEQAQVLRNDGKYLAATQEALKCGQPQCGQALIAECSKLYAAFQEAVPSVVVSASDPNGNEVPNVRVVIDVDAPVNQLDGRPINLDPGNHSFEFTAPGFSPLTRRVTLLAGERFRPVSVVLNAMPTQTVGEPAEEPEIKPKHRAVAHAKRQIPTATYVLAGVGAVAAGSFIAFQMLGSNAYSSLETECSPRCSPADVDSVRQKYTISYASLGVSAAAFAGAFGFYLFSPHARVGGESALLVGPTPGGASAEIVTRF